MDIEVLKLKAIKNKICNMYAMCKDGCPFSDFEDCTNYKDEEFINYIIQMNERYFNEHLEIKTKKIEISEDEIISILGV